MNLLKDLVFSRIAALFLLATVSAFAQVKSESSISQSISISQQLITLNLEKKQVLDNFEESSRACWQIFAVNDCLAKARQLKYQRLAPLDQREYELNSQQRAMREFERRKRLADKEPLQN